MVCTSAADTAIDEETPSNKRSVMQRLSDSALLPAGADANSHAVSLFRVCMYVYIYIVLCCSGDSGLL